MCLLLSNTPEHSTHCGTGPGGGGPGGGGPTLTGQARFGSGPRECASLGINQIPMGKTQRSLKMEKTVNDPECLEAMTTTERGAVSTR